MESNEHRSDKESRNMTQEDLELLLQRLFLRCKSNGKLRPGAIRELAPGFKVAPQTVSRFWNRAKIGIKRGEIAESKSRKRFNGAKKINVNAAAIKAAQLSNRTTLRGASSIAGVSLATLCRRLKSGEIRALL